MILNTSIKNDYNFDHNAFLCMALDDELISFQHLHTRFTFGFITVLEQASDGEFEALKEIIVRALSESLDDCRKNQCNKTPS